MAKPSDLEAKCSCCSEIFQFPNWEELSTFFPKHWEKNLTPLDVYGASAALILTLRTMREIRVLGGAAAERADGIVQEVMSNAVREEEERDA